MLKNKIWASDKLVREILVACGNVYPTSTQRQLIFRLLSYAITNTASERVKKLSERERTCLFWIAHGKTVGEIADLMKIKITTVQTYRQRIRTKLKCTTLAQAVFCSMCYQPLNHMPSGEDKAGKHHA